VAADDIDHLYELPLDEFTKARDELAQRLRSAGETESARRVKAMRKPTVPAWALNQLARRHGEDMRALLDAAERMKDASPDGLRELSAERRRLVAALVAHAEQILKEAGHSAGAAHRERISQALLGATGEESREALLRGRLAREPAPAGFEAFGAPPDEVDVSPRPARRTRALERAEELAREADAAAAEAHRLRRAAEAAERSWRKAEQAAERAAVHAEKLRDRADKAADDATA
jgi:hypothetical protein